MSNQPTEVQLSAVEILAQRQALLEKIKTISTSIDDLKKTAEENGGQPIDEALLASLEAERQEARSQHIDLLVYGINKMPTDQSLVALGLKGAA